MTSTEMIDMLTQMDPAVAGGVAASFLGLGAGGVAVASKKGGATRSGANTAPIKNEKIDVSIPYDAAAKLAYDIFRASGKEAVYATFKARYEQLVVAQVTLKKCEREFAELN
jgi:hypothetical protein